MTTLTNSMNGLPRRNSIQREFIASKTVANVLSEVKAASTRQLVDLPSTATMEEAFDVLLAEDILSVPVYQLEADQHAKKYLAIVSVLDLLKLLNDNVDRSCLLRPLAEAAGRTAESSQLVSVRPTDSLQYVMELFSTHAAHRVLVLQEESPILLSQMDVVKYLQAHNHQLGPILDLTTPTIVDHARTRRGEHPLASLNYRCTAMDAFLQLAQSRVGALAVVDDEDDMVGELSAENLRGLNRERYDALQKPVVMYLKESQGDLYPPLTCHDRFTLSQLMTAFVLRKAHRLWWVDEAGHVKGVITLSDFLGTFIDASL
ncbi:hypothetical protein BDB00DRAFT_868761 [Zychaea mexicana]|uniref:uncharacterized protein n=1 Tax=Zychaea mexicana TaxID=64656 RepID=UPI0022FF3586|nr:uncharacterized protein BDB00DRAFT_868761 [Zychaea mexicana]KAI9497323.1 hypothetical protein BDB00DRAFT_868761 [Zychaea mexicana]